MSIENPAQTQIESNPAPEFDTSAAIAEISSDLFGQGSDEDKSGEEQGVETPAEESSAVAKAVESPPAGEEGQTEVQGENSAEVQKTGAPQTWTKEALEEWAKIPPRAQEEILKREADMYRGIEQYKAAAQIGEQYSTVVQPYEPLLQAEGVNPVELFQNFAANHYLLSRGTPEQKVQLAASMLNHYGIDLGALIDTLGEQALNPPDPRVMALEREVQNLRQNLTPQRPQVTEADRASALRDIENFANDPAHPFFNDLIDHIAQLMETGVAKTLKDAYETAVYANPVTRQKEIDRLTAAKKAEDEAAERARKDKHAQSMAADVKTNSHQRDGTVALGSMDDTLEQTLASIRSRG